MNRFLCIALCVGCAIGVVLTTGCDQQLQGAPDDVPLEDIIDLQRSRVDPLPMDGVTADTLVATLPVDATTRLVTFKATRGVFPITGGARTLVVRAEVDDATGHPSARAALRADTSSGVAIVSATVSEWTNRVEVPFTE